MKFQGKEHLLLLWREKEIILPFSNYARTSIKDTSNMIMNLCGYEHTWAMCVVVWVKVSSPLQVTVISKGFLTLTDFKVEWTDTNASPLSSYMHVSIIDPTNRQNSIQGIYTLSLDSLARIPVAFQIHPFSTKQTRPAVLLPYTKAALILFQQSPTCFIFNLYSMLILGIFKLQM